MDSKKNTGSYYTPKILSDFLMSHILAKYLSKTKIKILEPSCGDGQFIKSFFDAIDFENFDSIEVDVVDIDKNELSVASKLIPQNSKIKSNAICGDYLEHFLKSDKKYNLIFGNPPYIRKKNMGKQQIDSCEKVHNKARNYSNHIKSKSKINNIWTLFVEASIMSITDDGIMCLVIPAEIMLVNYSQELRSLIQSEFDRVEIFAFNELIFKGIQQDVVAIIGVKGVVNNIERGFSFYQVNYLTDLKEPRFTEKHNNIHRTTLNKWSNYILSDSELNFIEEIKKKYFPIDKYCEKISAGIVTAANDYFIISQADVETNRLLCIDESIKPILPKGSVVPNLINFTSSDFERLASEGKRVNFINFPDITIDLLPDDARQYIKKGEQLTAGDKGELNKRFKMTQRKNWYHVPNTWTSAGLFIKRSSEYPKIIVNAANSYATDSFYRIIPQNGVKINNIVFSFYNSLTMVLAELEGRFYGGGVLELTPNEFKNLYIPYNSKVSDKQFLKLDEMFRKNESLNTILNYTDKILFKTLGKSDVDKLRNLRLKLMNRRLKIAPTI